MNHQHETIEKGLMLAGLDALRQVGGDDLVSVLLGQAGMPEFAHAGNVAERIPFAQYLHWRDTALDFLQESFAHTAFETGKILVQKLKDQKESQVRALIAQFQYATSKLPLIGQVAVLAAKGNPGTVRAAMKGDALVISIENCPECRGLQRTTPFCSLNQGVTTAFAELYLNLAVRTEETKCLAIGDSRCQITVTLAA